MAAPPPVSPIARARVGPDWSRPIPLPRDLLERAAHRLGTAALAYGCAYVLAIAAAEYVYHVLGRQPPDGWDSGYTVALVFVLVSAVVYAATRYSRLPPERVLTLGLVFEVVGAFGITLGTVADTVWQVPFHAVGIPWACAWIVFFPFLVPEPPLRSGVAAFLSALMGPTGLVVWQVVENRPMPPPSIFAWLTIPPLICAGAATAGARIVYRLTSQIGMEREVGAYRLEE